MLYNFKFGSIAEIIYGSSDDFSYSGYNPIVRHFGNIIIHNDDDDYQGDSRYLIESSGQYGLLIIGWGSCSGCDALQGCSTESDLKELVNSLWNSIHWFDTIEQVLDYINSKEREGSYYYHSEKWEEFTGEVNALLHK